MPPLYACNWQFPALDDSEGNFQSLSFLSFFFTVPFIPPLSFSFSYTFDSIFTLSYWRFMGNISLHAFLYFYSYIKNIRQAFSFLFISSSTFCPCVSFSFLSSIHSFISVSSIIWCGCCHSRFFPGLSVVLRIEHVRVGCSMRRSSYKTQRDIQT